MEIPRMEHNKASLTALYAAWMRAKHYYAEEGTKIFEDPVAQHVITASEHELLQAVYIGSAKEFLSDIAASSPDDQTFMKYAMRESAIIAEILSRARYAEEQLAEAVWIPLCFGVLTCCTTSACLRSTTRRPKHSNASGWWVIFEITRNAFPSFAQASPLLQ